MNTVKISVSPNIEVNGDARFSLTILSGTHVGRVYQLPQEGNVVIGRTSGDILFENDEAVSDGHAILTIQNGDLSLKVLPTVGGIYRRINGPTRLMPGDLFSIGHHHMRFLGKMPSATSSQNIYGIQPRQMLFAVEEILRDGVRGQRILRPGPKLLLGRNGCNMNFNGDQFISERHCQIELGKSGAVLMDLGSTAGTFLRMADNEEALLCHGEQLRIGDQFIEVSIG